MDSTAEVKASLVRPTHRLLHPGSWDYPRDAELDAGHAVVLLDETLAGSEHHTLEWLVHLVASLDLHVFNLYLSVDA